LKLSSAVTQHVSVHVFRVCTASVVVLTCLRTSGCWDSNVIANCLGESKWVYIERLLKGCSDCGQEHLRSLRRQQIPEKASLVISLKIVAIVPKYLQYIVRRSKA